MGLTNIRERVSTLGGQTSIWSQAGAGTTLHLYLPLLHQESSPASPVEDQRLLTAITYTHRLLKVGIIGVEFVAALALLYTPGQLGFPLISCGVMVATCTWFWAQRHLAQIALSAGRESPQHSRLQAQSFALLAGLVLALFIWPGYLNFALTLMMQHVWFFIVIACLAALPLLLATIGYFYQQGAIIAASPYMRYGTRADRNYVC